MQFIYGLAVLGLFLVQVLLFQLPRLSLYARHRPNISGRVSELGFLFQLLLLLMGTFLAFRARRDVWVLVLAALFIISEFGRFVRSEPSFGLTKLRAICVIVALTVTISLVGLRRQISEQQQGFSETFQWIQSHTY